MAEPAVEGPGPTDAAPPAGRYEILGKLAEGGMAELFIARRSGIEGFRKMVALKRIRRERASDPAFIEMFLEEARLAAQLDHPNVVHVHDIGQAGEDFFFTMEYLHGQTVLALERAVADARVQPGPACRIAAGAAAGLHHAHERLGFDGQPLGIVHRDVSPTNVIVTYDGVVKLVDFGVAKAAERSHETTTGTLKGKTPYMSPEQCRSRAVDPRTDVWALGVMLYEMLTGQRPFRGDSDFELMKSIVEEDPPRPPGVPEPLHPILDRALQKRPGDRYATARGFQQALEAYLGEHHRDLSSAGALADYLLEACGPKPYPWQDLREPIQTMDVTRVEIPTANMPPTRPVLPPSSDAQPLPARARWLGPVGLVLGASVATAWFVSSDRNPSAQPESAPATVAKPEPVRASADPEPEAEPEPAPPPADPPVSRRPELTPEASEPAPVPLPKPKKARRKPKAAKPQSEPKPDPTPAAEPDPLFEF